MIHRIIHRLLIFSYVIIDKIYPKALDRIAIYLFLTPPNPAIAEKKWRDDIQIEKRFIADSGGERFFMQYSAGEGPTVLLLHGWSGKAAHMAEILYALKDSGYKAVAIDAPAHGDSSGKQTNILEIHQIVKQLADEHNGFAAIAGHSFGGMTAIFSTVNGVKTQKIITIGSPSKMDYIYDSFLNQTRMPERIRNVLQEDVKRKTGLINSDVSSINIASRLTIPALFIHDRNDRIVPFTESTKLNNVWPGSEIKLTQNLGHNRILANKDICALIVEFVRK